VDSLQEFSDPLVFKIGKLSEDRYWLERPDGLLMQMDTHSKKVLERLENQESISSISKTLEVSEEEIRLFLEMLGIHEGIKFLLYEQNDISVSASESNINFYNPWLEHKWFFWCIIVSIILSIVCTILFITSAPIQFASDIKDQWMISGLLTLAVLIHELGHFSTMPRNKNISVSIHWSGPVPLLSIVCNNVWELSKWQRMRINLAGFVSDVMVCGLASMVGLWFDEITPWIWSFLIVQIIRMLFAVFPFLPGDGYWMIVDLFNHPNLWKNSLDQLKQRKINWLSLYACLRILFQILLWGFYVYIIYQWLIIFFIVPIKDAFVFFLQPAAVLLLLNLSYHIFIMVSFGIGQLKRLLQRQQTLEP
jgi:putative peptide zinc metalloprotease protein